MVSEVSAECKKGAGRVSEECQNSVGKVTFLKKLIFFNSLDEEMYFSNFEGNNYKSVKNKTGYDKYVELNNLKKKHLQQIKNDAFIKALLLFLKDPQVPPTNAMFNSWYRNMFTDFAINIAEVYSHNSDKIHNAKFDISDQLPAEYAILKQPKLDRCINYIMSFYGVNSNPGN